MDRTLRAGHPTAPIAPTAPTALIVLLVALAACTTTPDRATVTIHGTRPLVIQAEIADEPAEHIRGLMGRTALPPGTGMLFVFDDVRKHSFWMKDTLIPLDLLVFRDDRVVQIFTMDPCTEDDEADCVRYPTEAAAAALEVAAGTARDAGIAPGSAVEISL